MPQKTRPSCAYSTGVCFTAGDTEPRTYAICRVSRSSQCGSQPWPHSSVPTRSRGYRSSMPPMSMNDRKRWPPHVWPAQRPIAGLSQTSR